MIKFLFHRLLLLLPTLIVPLVLVFVLLRLAPGDPAAQILGDQATPQQIAQLHAQLGLDRPLPLQFGLWIGRIARLDLGESLFFHKSVLELLPAYGGVTLAVALAALAIAVVLGCAAGVLAAVRHDTIVDRGAVALTALTISLPEFWLALILIFFFAVQLGWLPVAGYAGPGEGIGLFLSAITLPALALGLRQSALLTRMMRSAMLDVLGEPYIVTARAQGLPESRVLRRYALRMAAIPVITVIGLSASYLLSGAVAIELIFSLPGLGKLLVDAVSRRDYPVVEGAVLLISLMLVVLNLAIDIAYALLDPRVRFQR